METKSGRSNIQNAVYGSLRKNITNLMLEPGTGISEKEIALRYKVSRTPVREAFIHLEKEGLVKVVPQKETVVSLINFSRVEQEFFLREALEIAVLELFVKKSMPVHFARMEQLIERQTAAIAEKNIIKFVEYDDDFHYVFFDAAEQNLSWELLQNMSGHYHRVRLLSIRLNGIAKEVINQHKALLKALKKKNTASAREQLKLHIHRLDAEEELLRKEFPAYFEKNGQNDPYSVDFGAISSEFS